LDAQASKGEKTKSNKSETRFIIIVLASWRIIEFGTSALIHHATASGWGWRYET
jgi:hypothetical protein